MNVRLKKVQKNDSGLIVKWRNENKEFFPEQPDFTVGSQVHWFLNTYLLDPADNYYIVIADGTPVGTIAVDAHTAFIGRVLLGNKAFERKGIMGEALEQLIDAYGFDPYYLKVLEPNKDAIAFYKKHHFFGCGTYQGFLFMERVNA